MLYAFMFILLLPLYANIFMWKDAVAQPVRVIDAVRFHVLSGQPKGPSMLAHVSRWYDHCCLAPFSLETNCDWSNFPRWLCVSATVPLKDTVRLPLISKGRCALILSNSTCFLIRGCGMYSTPVLVSLKYTLCLLVSLKDPARLHLFLKKIRTPAPLILPRHLHLRDRLLWDILLWNILLQLYTSIPSVHKSLANLN